MTKHEGKNVTTNSNYNTIQYTIHVRSKASTQNQANKRTNKREKKIDWSKTRQDKTEYGRSSGSGSTKGIEWNKNESKTGNKASARKKKHRIASKCEWVEIVCVYVSLGTSRCGPKSTHEDAWQCEQGECMCVFWCGYFNVNRSRFDNLFSALPK